MGHEDVVAYDKGQVTKPKFLQFPWAPTYIKMMGGVVLRRGNCNYIKYSGFVLHEGLLIFKNLLVSFERGPFEHLVGDPGIVAWSDVEITTVEEGFEARAADST